ncbi:MAG: hypothetical protein LUO80_04535 [Methylococcaceae bacterium]|jgi:hypothetical protein|nr:hypothetical protein [Methylococcaceae bacterium]
MPFATKDTLRAGIEVWHSRPDWPQDFHNSLYRELAVLKAKGILMFWNRALEELSAWRAIRPKTKEFIDQQGRERLEQMASARTAVLAAYGGADPDLSLASWNALEDLYRIAVEIKGASSPVFASKLCHFLMPDSYIVIDGEVVGWSPGDPIKVYQSYWTRCQEAWHDCTERARLRDQLASTMTGQAIASYPWSTKITELCYVGAKTMGYVL